MRISKISLSRKSKLPMFQQYRIIHEKHPDMLLLIKNKHAFVQEDGTQRRITFSVQCVVCTLCWSIQYFTHLVKQNRNSSPPLQSSKLLVLQSRVGFLFSSPLIHPLSSTLIQSLKQRSSTSSTHNSIDNLFSDLIGK